MQNGGIYVQHTWPNVMSRYESIGGHNAKASSTDVNTTRLSGVKLSVKLGWIAQDKDAPAVMSQRARWKPRPRQIDFGLDWWPRQLPFAERTRQKENIFSPFLDPNMSQTDAGRRMTSDKKNAPNDQWLKCVTNGSRAPNEVWYKNFANGYRVSNYLLSKIVTNGCKASNSVS